MARLNTLLLLVVVALSVVALLDCLVTDRSRLRSFPRGAWIALIALCPVAGAIAWFRAGRATPVDVHARHTNGSPARPGGDAPGRGADGATAGQPGQPIGPEDDPAFIRMLADTLRNG